MSSDGTEENPALSVMITIPFYANLSYLRDALQSLVNQSDTDWTALVIDDASPERGAAEAVAQLGDTRVTYLRNETNLGVAGNFNRCFDCAFDAGADIVAILHADDLLEQHYVARVRQICATQPDASCVAPKVTIIDEAGRSVRTLADTVKLALWPRSRRMNSLAGEAGLRRLLVGQFFYCPAISYRTRAIGGYRWDARLRQAMDLDLYGRLLLDGARIVLVDEPLYRYRRHAAMTTETNSAGLLRTTEEIDVTRKLVAFAEQRGWRSAARAGRLRPTVRAQAIVRASGSLLRGDFALSKRLLAAAVSRP